MFSVRLIMVVINLSKLLYEEILKMVLYLKNWSQVKKIIITYQRANEKKPNLKHLLVFCSWTKVNLLESQRKKLNDTTWQEILVVYKRKNFI